MFFNAQYEQAAAAALALSATEPDSLAACELRTSAILFQLKAAVGDAADRKKALADCEACPEWMAAFQRETTRGQELARQRLKAAPDDEMALFFLGKLDLNHVWLHLGTLGRRTGWSEYWEARRSLDTVLEKNPANGRARVARAWIDYIVDTRMPRMTRWLLGGGDKKKALKVMEEAASDESDFFVHAEAMFALWDVQTREGNHAGAVETARALVRDFPENRQLTRYLGKHGGAGRSPE